MSAYNEFAEEIIEAANAYWEMFFTDEPHTGLMQIDHLRSYANNAKWSDVLRAGFSDEEGLVALSHVAEKRAAMINDPRLNEISTGRSTSFADRIVELLKYHTEDRCKFEFYDVDRHRVARCGKTGLLIDPSSKNGAFLSPEDEWVEILGSQASWKWDRGKHSFVSNEPEGNPVKVSKEFSSKEEALVICLLELPKAISIPTVFRSFDRATKKAAYHAMIAWSWKSKSLKITPDLSSKRKLVIRFGGGTEATHWECIEMLAGAIKLHGGPHGEKQWETVALINEMIWDAAVEVWGLPQVSIIEE